MAVNICNGNHKYGLWDNNSRTCFVCGYKEILPMNDSIKGEISKQEMALGFLNKFLLIEDSRVEAVQGIQVILNDYLNYLSVDSLSQFQDKVKRVAVAHNLQELSIGCILLYVEKLKNHETTTEVVDNAFDEFIKLFAEEVREVLSSYSKEKRATL